MAGRIHIYCGDGKGKTTAAIGLAVRTAGAGKKVVFTQFFKDGSSSEIKVLQGVENIQVMHSNTVRGFWKQMTDTQKATVSADYTRFFGEITQSVKNTDLLVLDEIISACNHGAVAETALTEFLCSKPKTLEVVLTGRNPSDDLMSLADYVTQMQKIKHPYDCGITARKGIEF